MPAFTRVPLAMRPREKLRRWGAAALSETELWCCVFGQGSRRRSVVKLARAAAQPNFQLGGKLLLGTTQYARWAAVQELRRRTKQQLQTTLTSVNDVLLLCQDMCLAKKEILRAIYCSVRAEVLQTETLALGGLNAAYLEPKDLFYPLRWQMVDSLVLCHNHPSGDPTPSTDDLVFTERMSAACQLMGLNLRDHIIVAKRGYRSWREDGFRINAAGSHPSDLIPAAECEPPP